MGQSLLNILSLWHLININIMDCLASVRTWMTVNKLKPNDGKTDIMAVASSHNQCRLTNTRSKDWWGNIQT